MDRLWKITSEGPCKLGTGGIDLESHREDWIERDPQSAQIEAPYALWSEIWDRLVVRK